MVKSENYKIGCYIRVSTEEQAKSPEGSIKNQQERIKQAIAFKNLGGNFGEIVDFYIDRGKSGKDTNRAELQRLLRDITTGKINLVAVSELSRISRNILDFSEIWQMMKNLNCGFYSLRENFDSTTAAGEMVLFSMANLAQFERRQISERVAANMNSRASRGLFNGGTIPLGYKLDENKQGQLVVDEVMAEVVKMCFAAYLKHETLHQTAKWLNQNGYTPSNKNCGTKGIRPRNSFFYIDNLYRLLSNRAYLGLRKYKEHGEVKETKAAWPALIDEETFERVNRQLKQNKTTKKPHSETRFPYLLSGLVYCMDCGDTMCGKSAHGNGGKIGYYEHGWAVRKSVVLSKKVYKCDNFVRIGAKKLEPEINSKVNALLNGEGFAKKLYEEIKEKNKLNPHGKEIKRLQEKIADYDRQLFALTSRLAELPPTISATPIYKAMEQIEAEKRSMENLLAEKRVNGEVPTEELPNFSDFDNFLKSMKLVFNTTEDSKTKAQIIATLIKRIDVGRESIKITFFIDALNEKSGLPVTGNPLFFFSNQIKIFGSNTLTFGGGGGNRTRVQT